MMFKKKEFALDADNTNKTNEEREERKNGDEDFGDDMERIVEQWQRDSEQLKLIVPDFDLGAVIKNETFKSALLKGATVFEAYKDMSVPQKNGAREEIFQNARSARRGTGGATVNPAKMSGSDFKKYIEKIKNS